MKHWYGCGHEAPTRIKSVVAMCPVCFEAHKTGVVIPHVPPMDEPIHVDKNTRSIKPEIARESQHGIVKRQAKKMGEMLQER